MIQALNIDMTSKPDTFRDKALLNHGIGSIQQMGLVELHALQQAVGLGSRWQSPVVPAEWVGKGTNQMLSRRTLDFRARLTILACPASQLDKGCDVLVRVGLLLWMAPSAGHKGLVQLKPSTWLKCMTTMLRLVARGLSKASTSTEGVFESLDEIDLQQMSTGTRQREHFSAELLRMQRFADRGLWNDRPRYTEVETSDVEPSRQGNDNQDRTHDSKPHAPLPDEFVAEAGWRFQWISSNLGPNLLKIIQKQKENYSDLPIEGSGLGAARVGHLRRDRFVDFLRTFEWKKTDGTPISQLPFDLNIVGTGKGLAGQQKEPMAWPPTQWGHVLALITLLQVAHLFIFLFSVGSRIGEALSLRKGCVVRSPDGTTLANGRTYKFAADIFQGDERNWALPEVAIEALELQQQLVDQLSGLGTQREDLHEVSQDAHGPLWIQLGHGNMGMELQGSENVNLKRMIIVLNLSELLGKDNLTTHRFRKTIARLLALAVTGAPKILMDLFGHKTIEMTLHYILADPLIRAEMDEVARAQTIMFVEDALQDIDGCGGPAGRRLATVVKSHRVRHGADFGAKSIRELAETLTLGGTQTQIVRENILCMKTALQVGPCTSKRAGLPNPAQCASTCDHRLELAAAKQDAEGALRTSVRWYSEEKAADNRIMMEYWAGQVLSALPRFQDLRKTWSTHPVVAEILSMSMPDAVV